MVAFVQQRVQHGNKCRQEIGLAQSPSGNVTLLLVNVLNQGPIDFTLCVKEVHFFVGVADNLAGGDRARQKIRQFFARRRGFVAGFVSYGGSDAVQRGSTSNAGARTAALDCGDSNSLGIARGLPGI